jgi:hypothetical protein
MGLKKLCVVSVERTNGQRSHYVATLIGGTISLHCGEYSTPEEAWDWIDNIRDNTKGDEAAYAATAPKVSL